MCNYFTAITAEWKGIFQYGFQQNNHLYVFFHHSYHEKHLKFHWECGDPIISRQMSVITEKTLSLFGEGICI